MHVFSLSLDDTKVVVNVKIVENRVGVVLT
jgi:hypothetical protein